MLILLATILIVSVLLLIRWFTQTDPQSIRNVFKVIVVVATVAALIVLLLTGRLYAFITGIVALAPLTPFLMRFFSKGAEVEMEGSSARPYTSPMTREEAHRILDLQEGATAEEIKKAHKNLVRKVHPDQGGSDYLAQQVNQARDILLGK